MKRAFMLGAAFVLCACSSMPSWMPGGGGWTTLINGDKGMDNFTMVGDANWRAEDGAIVAYRGKGGFLVSKSSYKDFQLRVEFWADHTANSGIYMRCGNPGYINDKICYEANIFDQRKDPSYGTGGLVHIAKVDPMPKAGGKWNTYDITVKGDHIVLVLNGQKTVDVRSDAFKSEGRIALQYAAGVVKFRKVEIKPL